MRNKSSHFDSQEPEEFGFLISKDDFQAAEETNSADEVVGEIGLVLIVILGIVVAINVVLTSLHIS